VRADPRRGPQEAGGHGVRTRAVEKTRGKSGFVFPIPLAELVAARLSADVGLAAAYLRVFGTTIASDAPEIVLVNIAKALAAFQETLRTGRTLFDGILMLQPERQ
jgi:cytochrome c peroxidase